MPTRATLHSISNPQDCACCGLPAIVGLDRDWLCGGCFDEELRARRAWIDEVLDRVHEAISAAPGHEILDLELPTEPEVDEIRSRFLCGDDE